MLLTYFFVFSVCLSLRVFSGKASIENVALCSIKKHSYARVKRSFGLCSLLRELFV